MATGLIAVIGSSASVTYTPQSNAKLSINWGGTMQVNGSNAITATGSNPGYIMYVAAGVPITITTGASSLAILSALEEFS